MPQVTVSQTMPLHKSISSMTLHLFITRKLVNCISLDIIKQYDTNMLITKPSKQDQNTYMVLCSIFPNKTYRDLYVIPLQNIYHQLIIISLFNISSSFSKIKILTQRMLKKNPCKNEKYNYQFTVVSYIVPLKNGNCKPVKTVNTESTLNGMIRSTYLGK